MRLGYEIIVHNHNLCFSSRRLSWTFTRADNVLQGHRRKRHKRDRRNQFIDVEAEVDEEDEEVDEEDEELP